MRLGFFSLFICAAVFVAFDEFHSAYSLLGEIGFFIATVLVLFIVEAFLFSFMIFVVVPWNGRRFFKKNQNIFPKIIMEWSEVGIKIHSSFGDVTYPWEVFQNIISLKSFIGLQFSEKKITYLPRRSLTKEQQADIMELSTQKHK